MTRSKASLPLLQEHPNQYQMLSLHSSSSFISPLTTSHILPYALFKITKKGLIEHVGFSTPLSSSNCYVLVAQKEGAIYVWNGNQSDIHSRGRAFEYARDTRRYFLNIPSIVNVSMYLILFYIIILFYHINININFNYVAEGEEPALFSKHLTQRKEEEEAEEEPNDLILYAVKQGAMKLDLKEVLPFRSVLYFYSPSLYVFQYLIILSGA